MLLKAPIRSRSPDRLVRVYSGIKADRSGTRQQRQSIFGSDQDPATDPTIISVRFAGIRQLWQEPNKNCRFRTAVKRWDPLGATPFSASSSGSSVHAHPSELARSLSGPQPDRTQVPKFQTPKAKRSQRRSWASGQ